MRRIGTTSENERSWAIDLISDINSYINGEDEFITKEEKEKFENVLNDKSLDLFVIRVYKCVDCGKWIIDILE